MPNPYRGRWLVGAGALAVGLVFMRAGPRAPAPADAPELGVIYAAPAEIVETRTLGRGGTLAGVLAQARITGSEFASLLLAVREHADPRRLRDRTEIVIRRWPEDGSTRAIDLRLNADSLVRLEREAFGWRSDLVVTPVVVDTGYAQGGIESGRTLYEAIVGDEELDLPRADRESLVMELADVFQFTLDFAHDMQPGDSYRIIYERERRPDDSTRRRRILAAEIRNAGKEYHAVHFEVNGDGGYYDLEGKSLRSGFSRYPVAYPRITSTFSWRRYHPILGRHRAHLGTDFGAAHGTPVKATADGVVVSAGRNGGYGNLIVLRHQGGYTTHYAHLSRFGKGIRRGARVRQGQTIGYVGSTGLATGPHLHYELRKGGRPLDVRKVKLPGGPPIPKSLMDEFQRMRDVRMALLDRYTVPGPRLAGSGSRWLDPASGI